MDKNTLKHYRPLKREVDMLQERINQLPYACAVVTASSREHPYCQHMEVIEGHPSPEDQIKRRRMEARKAVCQQRIDDIEQFINSVEDSLVRQVLLYRYADGLKWRDITAKLDGMYSEDQLRKKIERFLIKS